MEIPRVLHELLSIKRPSGGRGCNLAREIIIKEIRKYGHEPFTDTAGNIICHNKFNGVLFSSHYDTVHFDEGHNEIRCDDFGYITAWSYTKTNTKTNAAHSKAKRDILGADDAAGIYIMLRLLDAGVKGTYIFHADEEIGCLGSSHIAESQYSVNGYDISEYKTAIAFDRRGTKDLIYNQLGNDMASGAATKHLQDALNFGTSLNYAPACGVVTDTAMYADEVEECFNLSVGYYNEHTEGEVLDLNHIYILIAAILQDTDVFNKIPTCRVIPEEADLPPMQDDQKVYEIVRPETVKALCHAHPTAIAQLLETFGYDYSELFQILNEQDFI